LTSMDADGSMQGFDTAVIAEVSRTARVPVIASGGGGTFEHFVEAANAGADALLAASLFHFGLMKIGDLKRYLAQNGIPVRLDGMGE
jgi:cyclase